MEAQDGISLTIIRQTTYEERDIRENLHVNCHRKVNSFANEN
jgi:hypothetical protein